MESDQLYVYNTLTHQKEPFQPLNPPMVGLYVCGPTVYGDPHLGHARPAITFDLVFRYLQHLGYKVRYVRNITDVGHLEDDADEGEDKIGKKARLEKVEPMEIAQYYADRYHDFMDRLNARRPSIEPRATGHIQEQIKFIEEILERGYGYVEDGSVYFDVVKYAEDYPYGELSGRKIDELIEHSRELQGQSEKRHAVDFALWKKADPQHIMRWDSPWGEGFPGWHIECSAMSTKYLGEKYDIHGGGLDLLFPHHEAEIAQSNACHHPEGPFGEAAYWLHNNLLTINGQKMGKSLGNFITLEQLFTGHHQILERGFSPMTVRFFTLQAHYRGTLDFSNEALKAAEKGLKRLFHGVETLDKLAPSPVSSVTDQLAELRRNLYASMNDDFNSCKAIAELFEGLRLIYDIAREREKITDPELRELKQLYHDFVYDILGLQRETEGQDNEKLDKALEVLIDVRQQARQNKNFALADQIRNELMKAGIHLHDRPEGTEWSLDR